MTDKKKNAFQARLENQKAQLERHGYSAEVVVRTTPEATDIINFARMWEYIIVQADRKSRGFMAQSEREKFDQTRQDFNQSLEFMANKIKEAVERHDFDLTGSNFVSRIAQRYDIAERKKKAPEQKETVKAAEPKPQVQEAPASAPAAVEEVEGL